MTYQVLARKYRPQKFSEVLGQEHITRTLKNAVEQNRLHHAYLFTGVRGVGKTTVARILAKVLNCENSSAAEPCNECKNCRDISSGNHLDVQEIDGASNTGVDDVREIRERIKYLPSESKYKIYIIDEVHMLSTAAFNALLKTLEEPPAHVFFVFATTEPQKIPSTILSRCQRHDFKRIPVPVLVSSLKKIAKSENIEVEPDALSVIASEAEGSMRDSQSLFDQAVAYAGHNVKYDDLKEMLGFMDRAKLKDFLTALIEKNPNSALKVVDDVFNEGGNLVRLAQDVLSWIHGLLILSATGEQSFLKDMPQEERDFLASLSKNVDVSELEQMFRMCYHQTETIYRSHYPKMLLETMAIQLTQVKPLCELDSIIERLENVSRGQPRQTGTENKKKVEEKKIKRDKPVNPIRSKTIDEVSWKDFVKWLHNKKPQLSSIVEHGTFIGGGRGNVNLQYSKNSIYGEMIKEPHRKDELEDLIAKYFNCRYSVRFEFGNEEMSPGELKRKEIEKEKVKQRQIKKETLTHDIVKEATKILGADIEEIRVKGE